MTRIEVFQNMSPDHGDRAFVAVLEALERTPQGKRTITACMNFFGTTAEQAETRAAEFLAAERDRHAKAEAATEAASKRMRKSA